MIGTKFYKPIDLELYNQCATWSNNNRAKIIDQGDYYECVEILELTLEELKRTKLEYLKSRFNHTSNTAYIVSSIGFKCDANDIAIKNIRCLLNLLELNEITSFSFRDYDNQFHTINLIELTTIETEIHMNLKSLYEQKWSFEELINNCMTKEQLDDLEIEFNMMDFSITE